MSRSPRSPLGAAFVLTQLIVIAHCANYLIIPEAGWNCAHTRKMLSLACELAERHHNNLMVISERAERCVTRGNPGCRTAGLEVQTLVYKTRTKPVQVPLRGCSQASVPRPLRSGDWPAYLDDLSYRLGQDCTALFSDYQVLDQLQMFHPDVVVYDSQLPCAAYLPAWLGLPSVSVVTAIKPPTEDMFFLIPEPVADIPMHQSGLPRHMTLWQAMHNAGSSWSLDAALQQLQAQLDRQVVWQVMMQQGSASQSSSGAVGKLRAMAKTWSIQHGLLDALHLTSLVVLMVDPIFEVVPLLLPQHAKVVSPVTYWSTLPMKDGTSASGCNVSSPPCSATRANTTTTGTDSPPAAHQLNTHAPGTPSKGLPGTSATSTSTSPVTSLLVVVNSAMAYEPARMRALAVAIIRASARSGTLDTAPSGVSRTTGANVQGASETEDATGAATTAGRHSTGGDTQADGQHLTSGSVPDGHAGKRSRDQASQLGNQQMVGTGQGLDDASPRLRVLVAVDEDSISRMCCISSPVGLKTSNRRSGTGSMDANMEKATDFTGTCHSAHLDCCGVSLANAIVSEAVSIPPPLMAAMNRFTEDLRRARLSVVLVPTATPQSSLMSEPGVVAAVMGCASSTWITAAVQGLPVLCLPMQGDENDGSQRVLEAGIGERVFFRHSHRSKRVYDALAKVLFRPEVHARAAAVSRLLHPGPCDGACQLADLVDGVARRAPLLDQLSLIKPYTSPHSHHIRILLTGCLTTVVLSCLGVCLWRRTPPLHAAWSGSRPWHRLPHRPRMAVMETTTPTSWLCEHMVVQASASRVGDMGGGEGSPPASPSKLKPHKKTQSWTGS